MSHLDYLLAVIAFLIPIVHTKCFIPNGTDTNLRWAQSDRYGPCDPDSGGASMCCSQKYGGDTCVPMGRLATSLCYNQGSDQLWRESCTDSSWKSTSCVKLFMNVSNTDITVTNCSSYNLGQGFCYGNKNFGCCKAGMAVFIDPETGEQVATNPALKNITSSMAPSATSVPASSSSSSSSSQSITSATGVPKTGLSDSAVHGIIAGVTIPAALILVVIAFCMYRRRVIHKRGLDQRGANVPFEMPVPYPQWNEKSELADEPSTTGNTMSSTAMHNQRTGKSAPRAYSKPADTAELAA